MVAPVELVRSVLTEVSRTLPWLNHGKVARDAIFMMAEADNTAAKVCKALQDEHEKRTKYFKQGKVQKYALRDMVWVERHHKHVLSRHRQVSWYVPGVIVRKVAQDVYAVRVGDNKILDRDHTQLRPRAPDPSGRPVTFEVTAGDVDSDDEGEDDDFTAEKILTDKPDPGTPGGRLYKVRWKGFAASRDSWEPPSSFVPRYTTVWMDYLRKKNISLDVKDVLVHLVAAAAPRWIHIGIFVCFCAWETGEGVNPGNSGLDWPCILFTWSPHIYFIVVYVFRSTDNVSPSLIPLVHVVDQEETGCGGGHQLCVSSPLPWGMGDAYAVCGASMCPWDMGGGIGAHWGPPVLSSMTSCASNPNQC